MMVAFIDDQVLSWSRGKTIDDAIVIREHEGELYKLKGHLEQIKYILTIYFPRSNINAS